MIKDYILVFLILFSQVVFCQNQSNTDLEKEIKVSGKYFWGQSINDSLEKTKLDARTDMILNISATIDNNSLLNSNSDVFVNGIKYLSIPRGKKIRVIAYILKSDVSNIVNQKQSLNIIEIKYKETPVIDTITEKPNSYNIDLNKVKSKNDSSNNNINKDKIINSDNTNQLKADTIYTGNVIVDKIIQSKFIDELYGVLEKEKLKGRLVYSLRSESFANIENCYIIVINPADKKIVAVLDKGNMKRKNFINNEAVSDIYNKYLNMKYIWLQIF